MATLLRVGFKTTATLFDRALLTMSVSGNVLPSFASMSSQCGDAYKAAYALTRRQRMAAWTGATRLASGAVGQSRPGRALSRPRPRPEAESDSDSDSDSDDERGARKERGTTEFWRRKMRTFHRLIDLNNDGVVSYDDFNILAERFINLGHLSGAQEEEFRDALKVVWEDQWGKVHPYNLVTTQQYLDNMHHIINDKELRRKAHHFLPHLFEAIDKDQDRSISVEEFKLFFKCLDLPEEEAIKTFKVIDTNGDGTLSIKEFVTLGREFFFIEDESHPSTFFWGPLIDP